MFKTVFAAAFLAALVANVGCSAAPDAADSTSTNQDLSTGETSDANGSTGTITLANAEAQVDAVRAKLDPKGDNALLFDDSLAPAYLAAIKPIFAKTAPADKITLGGVAFTYVSSAVQTGAIFDLGVFDNAVASYQDLVSFSFYWGGLSSNPELWSKANLLISHSSASPLSDLQILELVSNANPADFFAGVEALHWSNAKPATTTAARGLVDDEGTFGKLNAALFGGEDTSAHDIDESNALAVSLFKRSYEEMRLLTSNDGGEIMIDLGGHIASVHQYAGKKATNGIALAKSILTSSELKIASQYFAE